MRRRKFMVKERAITLYVMLILAVINLFICVAGLLEWKSNYKGQEHTNNYI
ncbi:MULTISPECIES: hypothetical protein [Bacillus]|uniref:hypothetical protein n=1 Tax=Bacillus TaxID=1386 RepID=UPI00159BDC5C|nr:MULTISPECIES: hypothetical protein [Bacillus]MBK5495170.1 hypothetical protein [Bacillus sp. TH13]HDR8064091.1 hypothetical protein [Bacillus cereus]